jgi:cell division protein FtsW (lipid II flippase)
MQAGEWILPPAALWILIPPAVWIAVVWILHIRLNRSLPDRDPLLFPAAMFLCGWGLLIQARLSPLTALRQTIWLAAAGMALLVFLRLPRGLEKIRKYRYLWLGGALLALGATLVVGVGASADSPRLWLGIDGVFFQPSEFLRWMFPVFAAFSLFPHRGPGKRPRVREALPVLLIGGAGILLHLLQQDLGAAVLLIAAIALILHLTYRNPLPLLLGTAVVVGLLGFGYALNETVRARLDTWWNPWIDPSNTSYQVVQSLIAVASGGLIGRGPGLGSPSLVPVAYSDFIFSALAEEFGVLGAVGCLILIVLFVVRGLRTAVRSADSADRLIAACLSSLLGLQSILIIGGGLRLLPLTGVTLPWISYGGSSLVSSTAILGFLLVLSHKTSGAAPSPRPDRPVRTLAALFLIAFGAVGASLGWWGMYRASTLRVRTDNYRRVLRDLQSRRGDLFDRNGLPLAITAGEPGSYTREYPDPAAAPVIGFTTAFYGQGGMESALDSWLRGETGRSEFELWWYETILGVHLEGADAKLTIDRSLQDQGSYWFGGLAGSAVVIRAGSGDILALISQPTFDPATLGEEYEALAADPVSPLLNRATQGLYPPGPMLLPFFSAESLEHNRSVGESDPCADVLMDWILANPGIPDGVLDRFRFNRDPVLDLPTANVPGLSFPILRTAVLREFTGDGTILVSPMQMALAFSSLAAGGMAPAPRLVLRLETPDGWSRPEPKSHPLAMVPSGTARHVRELLIGGEGNTVEWFGCGASGQPAGGISWYAGMQNGGADPAVVIVALEGKPSDAVRIGRKLLALVGEVG